MVLRSDDAGEAAAWDALVDAAPAGDVYYRPGYARAYGDAIAVVIDAAGGRALIPLAIRPLADLAFAPGEPGGDAITPYGYGGVLPLDDGFALAPVIEALRAWCAGAGLVGAMLRLHPVRGQDAWPWAGTAAALHAHGPTTAVDLAAWAEPAGVIATLRKGHRADVLAARKQLEVRWARDAAAISVALGAFRELYEATMTRLGAGASYHFPPVYYARLAEGLGDRLAVALAIDAAGAPAAGAIFFADRDLAHYHLSATRIDDRVRGATALLINEAAAWARARGCTRLHLGGGTAGADALYHFKRGFGGPEYRYAFATLIADPARYDDLVARRAAANPTPPRPGFFPAYRG